MNGDSMSHGPQRGPSSVARIEAARKQVEREFNRRPGVKKIISLFQRNYDGDHLVRDEVVPGAEWVIAGEGVATRKFDGTCCLIRDGKFYKRREVKPGQRVPDGFEAVDHDEVTGKIQGWVPVGDGPEDRIHREAFAAIGRAGIDRTYELCGPSINGNPEGYAEHVLIPHGCLALPFGDEDPPPRTFDGLRDWFRRYDFIEGIVWHHPDGRMVKIKVKDFGIRRRPIPAAEVMT